MNKLIPFSFQQLYFLALLVLAIGMPTSVFLMSVGGILLVATWLLQGDLKTRLALVPHNGMLLVILSVYLLHIIGLAWTSDFNYAFNDLKIKIPLLVFPVICATLPKLEKKYFILLLQLFVLATFVSTLISFLIYLKIIPTTKDLSEIRNISPFISHIRLALLVCLSIAITFWLHKNNWKKLLFISLPVCGWFIWFLYILESATGYFILVTLFFFVIFYSISKTKNKFLKYGGLTFFVLGILTSFLLLKNLIDEIHTPKEPRTGLATHSLHGEGYWHHPDNNIMENGYYTWIYIAPIEMREAWKKRSAIGFDSLDHKGQPLSQTAIRYISSKGLRKDKEGVEALTEEDVRNIENGIANINYVTHSGLRKRIEQLIFEFDSYYYYQNAHGNSVTQRLEFWSTGWSIFLSSPIIGIGTGDAQEAFDKEYDKRKSALGEKNRLRSHNQFLAIMVSFGTLGLLLFLTSLLLPFSIAWKKNNILYLLFLVCAVLSFLTEDTLETQAGVTFFAYFTSLFLLAKPEEQL